MQKRELQKNAQAKAPAKLNAGAMPSEKPPLSEEKQKQLNGMLLDAAENGKTKRAERLLKVGASIEAKDNDGWTPLMWAAWNGRTPTCALLLSKGADVNAKAGKGDWKGMTASSIAEKGNKKKTAAFLKTMEWLAGITGNAFMKPFAECIAG